MAEIVAGIGCSHSPMLNSPPADYAKHADIDQGGRRLYDKQGKPCTYSQLLAQAAPEILPQIVPQALQQRAARCTGNVERLAAELKRLKLDALIIIGDDQNEQFSAENMPAFLVYWADQIENRVLNLSPEAPAFWKTARSQYHEPEAPRAYPVASGLAHHLIAELMRADFDLSQSRGLATAHGEGHAFGFVHRRLMRDEIVPIVPIAINTYFPPNQPRPRRCYHLGQAIRRAVQTWPEQQRIGIIASGGLSHFTVDEELDRGILQACRDKDAAALGALPVEKLNSGSSEIRNWVTVAGAVSHLETEWQDYVPCYRSAAGTGCGMAFALWA